MTPFNRIACNLFSIDDNSLLETAIFLAHHQAEIWERQPDAPLCLGVKALRWVITKRIQ